MRSVALISSAFAAGAFAGVINLNHRDIVTQTEIDVVTKVVMVTAGASAPAPTQAPAVPTVAAAPVPAAPAPKKHHGHHHNQQSAPEVVPNVQSNVEPAPAPPAPPKAPKVPKPAPVPVPVPSVQGLGGYAAVAVQQHNAHRQNHSAPAVVWDDALAQSAAALAAGCVFTHNVDIGPASSYGQNIASSSPATGSTANELKNVITDMWYNGEVNAFNGLYGQPSPDMTYFDVWGHFTQVVWQHTKKVGCATQNCPSMGYFTVCNYSPPGNYAGQYAQNVHQPQGAASI